MEISGQWPLKNSSLYMRIVGMMQWAMDGTYDIPKTIVTKYIQKNYDMASKHQFRLHTHVRYDSPWSISTKQIFVVGEYQYGHFTQSLQTHRGTLGIGIIL